MRKSKIVMVVLALCIILTGALSPKVAMGATTAELQKQIEAKYGFQLKITEEQLKTFPEDIRMGFIRI